MPGSDGGDQIHVIRRVGHFSGLNHQLSTNLLSAQQALTQKLKSLISHTINS